MFRTDKFELTLKALLRSGDLKPGDIVRPAAPSRSDLLLAHTPAWADKVLACRFTARDKALAELPLNRAVTRAHLMNVGGTLEALRSAAACGLGVNCGGGSHHAFPGHGEGFCLLNDVAVAARAALRDGLASRVFVADLDAHQGNGTAAALRGEPAAFTFSMHQADIYPDVKEESSFDLELAKGMRGREYLRILRVNLRRALDAFKPDLLIYVAGADIYEGDKLGGLRISMTDIARRDLFVAREAARRRLPLLVTLSGGYAENPADTVRIHANTVRAALSAWRRWRLKSGGK